ncbi:MAG TPA: hypothetical protein VIJ22_17470, partial [Polyangiaceae bacterium]
QGMQQAMPPQQGGAAMLPTPYGGFQAAPAPMQAAGQPGYSMGPMPESSVVVPKSKAGLFILLALVGLLVVGGVVALVVFLPRHGATAETTPEPTASATPPPSATAASTAPPTATAATTTTAPPVETQDAGATAQAALDGGATAAAAGLGADAAAAATTAEITIVCVPDCDAVKIDDKALDTSDAGTVPSEPVEVAVGPHTIAVGRATYLGATKRVTLKAGQKAKETFYLTKLGAAVPVAKPCGKFLERCPN